MSPRKSRRKSACFSSTTTSTPARAKRKPSIIPAGPPPATQQRVFRVVDMSESTQAHKVRGGASPVKCIPKSVPRAVATGLTVT